MKVFRKVDGTTVEIVKHTMDILKKNPWVEIHVGTDSQSKRRKTTYVTAIAYRYGTRGVHYIYAKDVIPRIRDKYTRLFKEAEMTIEVAEFLKVKSPSVKFELDFDYNSDEKHFSQKLVTATKGWAESLGYKVNIKPDNQIATKAADSKCR